MDWSILFQFIADGRAANLEKIAASLNLLKCERLFVHGCILASIGQCAVPNLIQKPLEIGHIFAGAVVHHDLNAKSPRPGIGAGIIPIETRPQKI